MAIMGWEKGMAKVSTLRPMDMVSKSMNMESIMGTIARPMMGKVRVCAWR